MAFGILQFCELNSLGRAHRPLMHMRGHPKDLFPQSGPKGPSDDIYQKMVGQAKHCQYTELSIPETLQRAPGYSRPDFFLVSRFLVGDRGLARSDLETITSDNFHAYG